MRLRIIGNLIKAALLLGVLFVLVSPFLSKIGGWDKKAAKEEIPSLIMPLAGLEESERVDPKKYGTAPPPGDEGQRKRSKPVIPDSSAVGEGKVNPCRKIEPEPEITEEVKMLLAGACAMGTLGGHELSAQKQMELYAKTIEYYAGEAKEWNWFDALEVRRKWLAERPYMAMKVIGTSGKAIKWDDISGEVERLQVIIGYWYREGESSWKSVTGMRVKKVIVERAEEKALGWQIVWDETCADLTGNFNGNSWYVAEKKIMGPGSDRHANVRLYPNTMQGEESVVAKVWDGEEIGVWLPRYVEGSSTWYFCKTQDGICGFIHGNLLVDQASWKSKRGDPRYWAPGE